MGLASKHFLGEAAGLAYFLYDQANRFDWFAAYRQQASGTPQPLVSAVYKKALIALLNEYGPGSLLPQFLYCVQTDSPITAHSVTRVASFDSTLGLLEIRVFIRQIPGPESLMHQESEIRFAPPAGRKGPHPPLIHPFTTNLSDTNKVGLDNVAYWGTGLRRSTHYHLNLALEEYLGRLKAAIRQKMGCEPLISKKIPRASRAGREGPRAPLIHAFATHLRDANKVGLDNLAYWSTGPERSTDHLINDALSHYLPQTLGYFNSERWPGRGKRAKVKQ